MADQGYPTAEQKRDRVRRQTAAELEEEAQLRGVFGTPEEREHERTRVCQEWDKIEHDKAQSMNEDELWKRHLRRMRSMAASLKCPKKAARRAKHFELAGLATAAKYFQQRAEALSHEYRKEIDPQSDLLIDNLNKFNDFVGCYVEKWDSRRPGEIWTRRGGQRVTKRPDGVIVPYFGPGDDDDKKDDDEEGQKGGKSNAKKSKGKALKSEQRTLMDALNVKKGPGGALVSKHFAKSEEALVKLVKAYLAKQKEKSEYKESGDLTKEQKDNSDYVKFNKGIDQAEKMARKFGLSGISEHEKKKGKNSSACRFLLASCLVFADLAAAMVRRRNKAE